jgi:Dyp-type peroxidase family
VRPPARPAPVHPRAGSEGGPRRALRGRGAREIGGGVTARLSDAALADIQRFITSGYGKLPYAAYLFLQIRDPARAQAWLSTLVPTVTTAARRPHSGTGPGSNPDHERPNQARAGDEPSETASAVNVGFTAPGLAALGLPASVCCTFPIEFRDGMATPERSAILGDTEESAPERWELGAPAQAPIHVALLVHGGSTEALARACAVQRGLMSESAGGVIEIGGAAQYGYRPSTGTEPFGFRDGMSQPLIAGLARGGTGVPTGEFILGYENHFQLIPPTPVAPGQLDALGRLPALANPHHAARDLRDLGANGSYVVYRKLQQDVAGFWRYMAQEAERATGRSDLASVVWMAARCMGRWPSGAPLAMAPDYDDPVLGDRNDFRYGHDVAGFACPVGAHVRRTHPRDVIEPYPMAQSLSMSEAHRLLRRARVFGPALFDPERLREPSHSERDTLLARLADDGAPRGIHFFCVNASIARQFEFVQQTWCNNPRFSGLTDTKDPIVGDNGRPGEPASYMVVARRTAAFRTTPLPRFVTVRGGAYLFMPSLRALEFLATFRALIPQTVR